MPEELPNVITKVTLEQMFEALNDAWVKEVGSNPTKQQLAILVAQWGGETGWGKAMHCYNVGNAKHRDGDGRDWTYFSCFEREHGKDVWYHPKHPTTAFRAFRTLGEGALDYFQLIYKKYNNAWSAVLSGDPGTYSHEIRKKGYYTADEGDYTRLMKGCFAHAMGAKWNAGGGGEKPPPVEPHPSLGAKDLFGAHEGAHYAIAAYERSIGARGYKLLAENEKNWEVEKNDLGPGNFEKLKPHSGDLALVITADGNRAGRVVTVAAAPAKTYESGIIFVTGMSASGIGVEKLTLESRPLTFDASYTKWKADEPKPGAGRAWVVRVLRLSDATADKLDKMPAAELKQWHIAKGEIVLSPGTEIKFEAKKKPNDPTVMPDNHGAAPAPYQSNKPPRNDSDGSADPAAFKTSPPVIELPPPVQVDSHTVKFKVGNYPGRIAFTIKKPGEPLPAMPPPGKPAEPAAAGKRDEFLAAAMNLLGAPFLAGSSDPAKGIDGPGLVSLCMKRVGLLKEGDPLPGADGIHAMFGSMGGKAGVVPDEILPGDLAWYGRGDHDNIPQQHCMLYLGGGRVLGPIPDGGPQNGAVQIIAAAAVPEAFAGWTHISDLGRDTGHTAHPGHPPAPGDAVTGALLPASPAARYDVLKALVKKKGGTWLEEKGKVNLVGVRNMHERCLVLPREQDWNDSLFASFLDDDGHKCSLELRASVSPGHDADKANKWHLLDGAYKFKLETDAGKKVLRPDGNVKAWLDVHGQGSLRPGDLADDKPPANAAAPAAVKDKPQAMAGDHLVRFKLTDQDSGKPLAGVRCLVTGPDGKQAGDVTTDAQGVATCPAAAGDYSVAVLNKNANPDPQPAPSNAKKDHLVRFKLTDQDSGKPLAGVRCVVTGPDGSHSGDVKTDAQGVATCEVPAEGYYNVAVLKEAGHVDTPPDHSSAPDAKGAGTDTKKDHLIRFKLMDQDSEQPLAHIRCVVTGPDGSHAGDVTTDAEGVATCQVSAEGYYNVAVLKTVS